MPTSLTELQGILADLKGKATFVTILARTPVKLCTSHFGRVWKTSRVNGTINFSYSNSVNRQRGREAEGPEDFDLFVAQPRKWGVRLHKLPFVQHKENVYLEIKVERSLGYTYNDDAGNEIATDEITPYLLPWRESTTQDLDREVILRDYLLENLLEVKVNGMLYIVDRSTIAVPLPDVVEVYEPSPNDPISLFGAAVDRDFGN